MKKILLLLTIVLISLIYPHLANAAACPSSNLSCTQFSSVQRTLCDSPCILVTTKPGAPGKPPASPVCACQMPNTAGSIPDGGRCQQASGNSDCAPGHYCWGSTTQGLPTCHALPASAYSTNSDQANIEDLCKSASGTECGNCVTQGNAWTAIGCIPTTPSGFIAKFLDLGIGIAGGIAFLLILLAGFQIITSAGNPEKLNAGKELLTSAISGLILIIFSLFLLRLIGFNILGLPGFG